MQSILTRQQDKALYCHPIPPTLTTAALPQQGRKVRRDEKLKELSRRQRHQHIHASGGSIAYGQKDKTELYLLLLFPHDRQQMHSLYKPLSCLWSCPFFQHLLPKRWQQEQGKFSIPLDQPVLLNKIPTSHLDKSPVQTQ